MNSRKVVLLANGTVSTDAINLGQLTAALTNTTVTGNLTVTGNGSFGGTGFLLIPKGTTAERPVSPTNGEIRYNTTTSQFEGYQGGAWGQLGGGATGGGADTVFVENTRVVTTDYTIPVGKSAESVGPITINSGITVTISSGERWVVL
jgi:hypothetical protein